MNLLKLRLIGTAIFLFAGTVDAGCPAPDASAIDARPFGTIMCIVQFSAVACPQCKAGWRHKCERISPSDAAAQGAWRPMEACLTNELQSAKTGTTAQQRAGAAFAAQTENFNTAPERAEERRRWQTAIANSNSMARQTTAMITAAQNQNSSVAQRQTATSGIEARQQNIASAGCNGYPLQSRGEHPLGMVCRCVYGGPSNQVGWWAVQPGNPQSPVIACGPPRDSTAPVAVTANDEDRQQATRKQQWQASQQQLVAEQQALQKQQAEAQRQQQSTDAARQNNQQQYSTPQGNLGTNKHSHVLGPDDIAIDGRFETNWHNDRVYVVKVQNRAGFPVDCDVRLRASFWTDTSNASNPLTGPGLANIKIERGSASNVQPGNWATALERTHLVGNSRIDYYIENCRVSALHLLSEHQ